MQSIIEKKQPIYIDGQWFKGGSNDPIEVINPATEQVITQIGASSKDQVDQAAMAARKAFDSGIWSGLTGAQRADYLQKIADGIKQQLDQLAMLEVLDNGKPFAEAKWDIEDTAGCFEYYAKLATDLDSKSEHSVELPDENFTSRAVKEPVGVIGAIIPWNFPMLMAAWKVAPALAAGCCILLKPSEITSLTAIALADIIDQAGLPAGVFNLLPGYGAETGQAISQHPEVDKLAFTGSVPTGSKIMQTAATQIKNISLELGGKSPFIIFSDSDIEAAVEWIMFGIFWNQGQVCSATSRVLVEQSLYQPLLERLIEEAEKITIGSGDKEGILLGPLVNKAQYDKVKAFIARAKTDGATIIGGQRPQGLDKGYFLTPTIVTEMSSDSEIWREEVFGPVVCVKPFEQEQQALELANDSKYGLAAAVMSKDQARCDRMAKALKAGIIWINCSQPTFVEAPWGGYKQSGIGRELGQWGLNNYLETKQITQFNSKQPWAWYIK